MIGALGATVLGYPRIGPRRELKRAVEGYWDGSIDAAALQETAAGLRRDTWTALRDAGIDTIPSSTFSFYDSMLDTAVMVGAIPDRYRAEGRSTLDTAFAMARGTDASAPLAMTKWFDTNYHYIVPELGVDTPFGAHPDGPLAEVAEAAALGIEARPALIGPATFLGLARPAEGAPIGTVDPDVLDPLVEVYAQILDAMGAAGVGWVQLDEPIAVTDLSRAALSALRRAYLRLGEVTGRPRILVTTPYGDPGEAIDLLVDSPVDAIHIDLVTAPGTVGRLERLRLADTEVVAGVVDGRNVWRTDLAAALDVLAAIGRRTATSVGTATSLLHVPYSVTVETDLDPEVAGWLAFAEEKVAEVVTLARGLRDGRAAVSDELSAAARDAAAAAASPRRTNPVLTERVAGLSEADARRTPYAERRAAVDAHLGLGPLPTTTIGSFPQTADIRRARSRHRAGTIGDDAYAAQMRGEIARVVALQDDIGLDVLVHGEPERNDMVQYFAELLDGYATTELGWVQSYGTRCVRPPILFGDVTRPEPMTVEWARYAQSLTERPVKGMLTGPVTMLAWSFVRDDQPLADSARHVALAIADETTDLEAAGIGIIQVDEPALRELLPLRERDRAAYLEWAVEAFRLSTSAVSDSVQIHTHMCYGEFNDIAAAIEEMDVDVISMEAVRARMAVARELAEAGYSRGIGPGVYDIHSPRIPTTDEMVELLELARDALGTERLWVNPDCGLKTRRSDEVEAALRNLVAAAQIARAGT